LPTFFAYSTFGKIGVIRESERAVRVAFSHGEVPRIARAEGPEILCRQLLLRLW
jgi:hypothetical protein